MRRWGLLVLGIAAVAAVIWIGFEDSSEIPVPKPSSPRATKVDATVAELERGQKDAGPPEDRSSKPWEITWLLPLALQGTEYVFDLHIDRAHDLLLIAGMDVVVGAPNGLFLRAHRLSDGAKIWARRMDLDPTARASVTHVLKDGTTRWLVHLTGTLVLEGREIGERLRHATTWWLDFGPKGEVRRELRLPGVTNAVPLEDGGLLVSGAQCAKPKPDESPKLVHRRPGCVARLRADGAPAWKVEQKARLAYRVARVGDRALAYAEPGRPGRKVPKAGERIWINLDTGEVVERASWFLGPKGKVEVSLAAGRDGTLFELVRLPRWMASDVTRPDGETIPRTGSVEFLVERVSEDFEPSWSRSFGNRTKRGNADGLNPMAGPFLTLSGTVVVTGSFGDTKMDFGDGPVRAKGPGDVFVLELDAETGETIRAQVLGGRGWELFGASTLEHRQLALAGVFVGRLELGGSKLRAKKGREAKDGFLALLSR